MAVTSLLGGVVLDIGNHKERVMPTQPAPGKLSPELLEALYGIKSVRQYPRGALLFQQSYPVTGVYLVETGEVRVLLPTDHRQKQLLEVAVPGSILGLSECMSGEDYRVTAEAGDRTTAAFISQQDFLEFLRAHGDFCVQVVRLLSEDLHSLYHKFRSISAHPGRPRHRDLEEQLN
jgi:CRP/FNR family cyclic AMP-dependent transcriptional regulator